jgi:Chitobiase/beta-hexosaminidase C-terminal domain
VTVLLFCPTSGAQMYYTTNGSTPTTSSLLYTADGILLTGTGTKTVKAIGVKSGLSNSAVASATFNITP